MAERKRPAISILRIKKGDSVKTIYAKARRAFTAADLQKFTEEEDMVPAEQALAELEAIHREELHKLKRKNSKR
jgi:hypothetical protein